MTQLSNTRSNNENRIWYSSYIRIVVLVLLVVFFVRYLLNIGEIMTSNEVLVDFQDYQYAGRAVLLGENPYQYNQRLNILSYKYPPTLAILLIPIANLDTVIAQRIWTGVDQILFIAALILSIIMAGKRLTRWQLALLGVIVFGFYPIYTNIGLGQVANTLYFLIALTTYSWYREQRLVAAFALALAGSIKIIPLGLCVYFLYKREYRLVLYTVLFAGLIQMLPDLIISQPLLLQLVTESTTFYVIEKPLYYANQSLYGMFARLFVAIGGTEGFARLVAYGMGGAALLSTIFLSRPGKQRDEYKAATNPMVTIEVGLIVTGIGLLNPISWTHYYVWMLLMAPALIVILSDVLNSAHFQRGSVLAGIALIGFSLISQPFRIPRLLGINVEVPDPNLLQTLLQSVMLYGVLAVWGVGTTILWLERRGRFSAMRVDHLSAHY